MGTVYVLQLVHGKYYVGHTEHFENRMSRHFEGGGAEWTKLYKPIKVLTSFPGDLKKENRVTLACMRKWGFNNVRGGAWTKCEPLLCLPLPEIVKYRNRIEAIASEHLIIDDSVMDGI